MTERETIDAIEANLENFFKCKQKAEQWLRTINPLLGGVTPQDMINAGKAIKLLAWMEKQIAFSAYKI